MNIRQVLTTFYCSSASPNTVKWCVVVFINVSFGLVHRTQSVECGPRISSGEESVTMTRGNFVIRCNDRGFVHGMGGMRGQLGN